jgi:hypothetical protein
VSIPKLSKLKTANNNDFVGFIEKPNKNQKKDLLTNKSRMPLIIINPFFDNEVSIPDINPNSYNSRQNAINNDYVNGNVNRKRANISEKLSVGFIV